MLQLLGLLLPPFIDIINRRIKDSDIRLLVSVLFCGVIGLLLHGWSNEWNFTNQDDVATSILSVFGAAQFSFKVFWDESTLRNKMVS